MGSTISSKGQITIPLAIRERLGLHEGDQVEFSQQGDLTVLRPLRHLSNPFMAYAGVLDAFASAQQVTEWVTDLRDDADTND